MSRSFIKRNRRGNGPLKFLSPLGLHWYFGAPADIATSYLRARYPEVDILDYSDILMRGLEAHQTKILIDDLHLDVDGHKLVAEFAIPRIREVMMQIKSQNK